MNSEAVIKIIERGGALTMAELKKFMHDIEEEAINKGADMTRNFLSEKGRQLRLKKQQNKMKEFGQIVLDTGDYLYNMRRLRNGQQLEAGAVSGDGEVPDEEIRPSGEGKEDKRFRGKEKIQV